MEEEVDVPLSVVVVTGTGVQQKTPTRATVAITVEEKGDSAKLARDKEAKAAAAIKLSLVHQPSVKLTSESLSIQPNYRWSQEDRRNVLDGYRASVTLMYETTLVDQVGDMIDTITTAAPNARIGSVQMALADQESFDARADALELATKNALVKARRVCKASGLQFRQIVRVNEGQATSFMPEPAPMMMREAGASSDAASRSVDPGELRFSAAITMSVQCAPL